MSLGMDHDETFVVDHAERYQPLLAVVLAIIAPGQDGAFENQGGIDDVDATLLDDLLALAFVPFENQGRGSVWLTDAAQATPSPTILKLWQNVHEKCTRVKQHVAQRLAHLQSHPFRWHSANHRPR